MNTSILTQENVFAAPEFEPLLKALVDSKNIRTTIANGVTGSDIIEGQTTYREELLSRINEFINVCAMCISDRLAR